jgi:hypothetical protein
VTSSGACPQSLASSRSCSFLSSSLGWIGAWQRRWYNLLWGKIFCTSPPTPYKKIFDIPVPSQDVTYQTLPRREYFIYDVIIPAQREFGKWHTGWEREYRKAFFTV